MRADAVIDGLLSNVLPQEVPTDGALDFTPRCPSHVEILPVLNHKHPPHHTELQQKQIAEASGSQGSVDVRGCDLSSSFRFLEEVSPEIAEF